jgi:hypothetical protein
MKAESPTGYVSRVDWLPWSGADVVAALSRSRGRFADQRSALEVI